MIIQNTKVTEALDLGCTTLIERFKGTYNEANEINLSRALKNFFKTGDYLTFSSLNNSRETIKDIPLLELKGEIVAHIIKRSPEIKSKNTRVSKEEAFTSLREKILINSEIMDYLNELVKNPNVETKEIVDLIDSRNVIFDSIIVYYVQERFFKVNANKEELDSRYMNDPLLELRMEEMSKLYEPEEFKQNFGR